MRIWHSKRGGLEDKQSFLMFELIGAAIVIIVVIFSIQMMVGHNAFWKKYYAADLGLIADLENTNQGDFVVNYALNDPNKKVVTGSILKFYNTAPSIFSISLSDDSFSVVESPTKSTNYPASFPYSRSRYVAAAKSSIVSGFLVLSKIGTNLALSSFKSSSDYDCPSLASAKDLSKVKLHVIDAGAPEGYAALLQGMLATFGSAEDASNGFTLIIGADPKAQQAVVYYPDDMQSQKMACLMARRYGIAYTRYSGQLDNAAAFKDYVSSSKDATEFHVLLVMGSNDAASEDKAAYLQKIRDAVVEYYGQ